GMPGDATPIRYWDMGDTTGVFQLSPTNSILNGGTDQSNIAPSATNQVGVNPQVAAMYDTPVSVYPWRSPAFTAPVILSIDQPGTLPGDYHLAAGSPAIDLGTPSKSGVNAPAFDIDNQARPAGTACLPDSGADEAQTGGVCADLSITKSDGVDVTMAGGAATYIIVVSNNGPAAVTGAPVTDNFPASLTISSWTCTATAGSSCTTAGSGNSRTGTVSLLVGGSATFTAQTTLSAAATGSLANTASVAAPAGVVDTNTANNSATDTDTIVPPLPTMTILDNFNRANANTLGGNWSQLTAFGNAAVRVNASQAFALVLGNAYWNVPSGGFGAKQGAAFTFANAPLNNTTLLMKVSGAPVLAGVAPNFLSVVYQTANGGQIVVQTTTNYGGVQTVRATFPATFAAGDTLSAVADGTGTVYVYKTSGAVTTFVGMVNIPTSGAGAWAPGASGGRIGVLLPTGARVDDFRGGTLP
ncbi:MAG: DUF11 domain-containing protein, partial [Anaerolineae bacterium]